MAQIDKQKKEMNRLRKIFADLSEDRLALCEELIQNAAFMAVQLRELQETIKTYGWVEEYKNGPNQYGTRVSPAAQMYNKVVANYGTVIRQLAGYLPDGKKIPTGDDPLGEFLECD